MGSLSSHSVFGCRASEEGMLQPRQGKEHAVHRAVWVYDAGCRSNNKSRKVFGKTRVLAITIKTLVDASRAQQCAASGACGMQTAWLWGSLTMKP